MYEDYTIKPYISPDRDPNEVVKPVPKRNMEPLADGLLAGDIILLCELTLALLPMKLGFQSILNILTVLMDLAIWLNYLKMGMHMRNLPLLL